MNILNKNLQYNFGSKSFSFFSDNPNYMFEGEPLPDGQEWLVCLNNGSTLFIVTTSDGQLMSPDFKINHTEYVNSTGISKVIIIKG